MNRKPGISMHSTQSANPVPSRGDLLQSRMPYGTDYSTVSSLQEKAKKGRKTNKLPLVVTMHGLTAEQNSKLPIPSVATWKDPTLFPVAISVFHDMHVSPLARTRSDSRLT